MYFLIFGCILFFTVHLYSAFRSRNPVRDISVQIGATIYRAIYSVFAGIGLILMIWGYALAKPSPVLYTSPDWCQYITSALMFPALILLIASNGPYGFIKKYIHHPMLFAIFLWSGGHLLSNGGLNSVILFGNFLAFALIDYIAVLGRPQEPLAKEPSLFADIFAVLIGSATYWLFLNYLHQILMGVPVI